MSANTRQSVTEILARFATLFAAAIDLISREARNEKMRNALLYALQLFKEKRLGDVLAQGEPIPSIGKPEDKTMLERRERFKAKLKEFGIHAVSDEFYASLPKGLRKYFIIHDSTPEYSLPELVLGGRYRNAEVFMERQRFGPKKLAMLEAALQERGLRIGMTLDEVKDVFGEVPPPRDHFEGANYTPNVEEFNSLIDGVELTESERVILGRAYGLALSHNDHRWFTHDDWTERSALWKLAKKPVPEHILRAGR